MKSIIAIIATIGTFFLIVVGNSCASASSIKIRPGKGGTIKVSPFFLSYADPKVRAAAIKEMEANCGVGKVVILQEGYKTVGEETSTSSRGHSSTDASLKTKGYKSGYKTAKTKGKAKSRTHTSDDSLSRTTGIKEWRIKYECAK
jgi:hypothetical protein